MGWISEISRIELEFYISSKGAHGPSKMLQAVHWRPAHSRENPWLASQLSFPTASHDSHHIRPPPTTLHSPADCHHALMRPRKISSPLSQRKMAGAPPTMSSLLQHIPSPTGDLLLPRLNVFPNRHSKVEPQLPAGQSIHLSIEERQLRR